MARDLSESQDDSRPMGLTRSWTETLQKANSQGCSPDQKSAEAERDAEFLDSISGRWDAFGAFDAIQTSENDLFLKNIDSAGEDSSCNADIRVLQQECLAPIHEKSSMV